MEIANKIVVVTGGASGIGKVMVEKRKASDYDRWLHGMRRLQEQYIQPEDA